MTDGNHYIQILIDGLKKKSTVLDSIISQNQEQSRIVTQSEFDEDAFENTVDEKTKLIDELNLLDDGFEAVYERVRPELLTHREKYGAEIKLMQELVSVITDKSVTIQTQEERNRKQVLSTLSVERKKIHQARANSKAVNDYYKSMKQLNSVDAQFLDSKK